MQSLRGLAPITWHGGRRERSPARAGCCSWGWKSGPCFSGAGVEPCTLRPPEEPRHSTESWKSGGLGLRCGGIRGPRRLAVVLPWSYASG